MLSGLLHATKLIHGSADIIVVERELQAIEDALDGAAKVLDNLREEKVLDHSRRNMLITQEWT